MYSLVANPNSQSPKKIIDLINILKHFYDLAGIENADDYFTPRQQITENFLKKPDFILDVHRILERVVQSGDCISEND